MREEKTWKEIGASWKNIGDEIRMIVVVKLAGLIMTIAPRTEEGGAWVAGIYSLVREGLAERTTAEPRVGI